MLSTALSEAVRLRGLPALAEVELRRVNRLEMRREVQRRITSDIPAAVIEGQSQLLKGLALVPEDFDYVAAVLQLMGDKLAGFYDPHSDVMFVAADLNSADLQLTLRHEIVHALQDQHYDLAQGLAYRPEFADRQSALHSLAEGDATSALLDEELGRDAILAADDLLAERFSQGFASDTAGVPSILKRSAVAPYVDGLLFVNHLRRAGGWSAVNAAWRLPPQTSEQLLHPDKYFRREPASAIAHAPARPDCQMVYTDTLGEQAVRIVFEEWATLGDAKEAAAGWHGDRVTLYSCGVHRHLHWRLAFDTENDAIQAAQLFLAGKTRSAEPRGSEWQVVADGTQVSVDIRH